MSNENSRSRSFSRNAEIVGGVPDLGQLTREKKATILEFIDIANRTRIKEGDNQAALFETNPSDLAGILTYIVESQEPYEQARRGRGRLLKRAGVMVALVGALVVGEVTGTLSQAVDYGTAIMVDYQNRQREQEALNQQAQLEAQQHALEQDIARRKDLELNHTLGTDFSTLSLGSWRVRYPRFDQNVIYVEEDFGVSVFEISANSNIIIPAVTTSDLIKDTDIKISPYSFSDGINRGTLLTVLKATGITPEDLVLRNDPSESIDNSVVIFEQVGKQSSSKYLEIREEGTSKVFQIKVMRPVTLPPRLRR